MNTKKLITATIAALTMQQSIAQSTIVGNNLSGGIPSTPNEFLGSGNNYDVIFKSNGFDRMRILANGYVGIGTSTPVNALSVQTGGSNNGIRITQTGTSGATLGMYNNTGRNWALFSTGSGNTEGGGHFGAYDYTAATWRFFINGTSGNVSLGGTNPQARLHVTGNAIVTASTGVPISAAYIKGNSNYSGVTNPEYTWYGNDNTGLFHPASGSIGFTNAGVETMRLLSNNFVGIGITNPLAKLHVDAGAIRVTGSNPAGGPMVLFGGNATVAPNGEWGIEYTTATAGKEGLNFWRPFGATGTTGNSFLFVANTGKVGVNTNNPTAQFTVNGNVLVGDPANVSLPSGYKLYVQTGILTEKVKVAVAASGNWSDYVFDKNYKLRSLEELEKYVQKNKHLPNIPSATEMVENGLDVATMDAKLLEKIEELSLYIIEQNKRIEKLEQKINEEKK